MIQNATIEIRPTVTICIYEDSETDSYTLSESTGEHFDEFSTDDAKEADDEVVGMKEYFEELGFKVTLKVY